MVPNNAVGILATNNDNPLEYKDQVFEGWLFKLDERTKNTMVLSQVRPGPHDFPSYLGAILSPDRTEVYWVNNSRPLP